MPKLTAKTVENAKPGRHADGGGLYLLVKPSAARSWVLRVQVNGKRRDVGLGGVQTDSLRRHSVIGDDLPLEQRSRLTLAEARELAARLRNVAKSGADPTAERKRDRSPPPTFRVAVAAAHKALSGGWSSKTADAFLSSLKDYALPLLGDKRVDDIEAADVAAALAPIWSTKPALARKVRQRIGKVLDYAKAMRWRQNETPRQSVSTLVGKAPTGGNMPAMPYAQAPGYFAKLGAETETVGRLALMFAIATAARSGEVREACWGHVDLEAALWNRPAELQRKTNKAHMITLNAVALDLLRRASALSDKEDEAALIFPNSKGKVLSDMTISKVMRDHGLKVVPHGFRSTFRDWAAEQMPGTPEAVAEAALGHVVPDAVVRAYKRAQFLHMRRELLDAWGGFLAGQPCNVVLLDQFRA